jgi:hypothetical protein
VRLQALDDYWGDVLYHVGEGKATEYQALMRMPAPAFYQLLDATRRNYKPLK